MLETVPQSLLFETRQDRIREMEARMALDVESDTHEGASLVLSLEKTGEEMVISGLPSGND